LDERRQPFAGCTSPMTRERHVRICERLGVQFPGPTRPEDTYPDFAEVVGKASDMPEICTENMRVSRRVHLGRGEFYRAPGKTCGQSTRLCWVRTCVLQFRNAVLYCPVGDVHRRSPFRAHHHYKC